MNTIQVHVPPVQIARHINDEQSLRESLRSRRFDGIEVDVEWQDQWVAHDGRGTEAIPLGRFIDQVNGVAEASQLRRPLRTLMEVRTDHLTHDDADRLLDPCERTRGRLELRFVGYSPETMNTLSHAAMSREDPFACQVYIQEDDLSGHVQWSKRDRLGLPQEIGYHLRLHAFPSSKRPSFEAAVATGRVISTTGWNPLYNGWRNVDLSGVWNVKRR